MQRLSQCLTVPLSKRIADVSDEEWNEILADESRDLHELRELITSTHSAAAFEPSPRVRTQDFNAQILVDIRRSHETLQAATGSRSRASPRSQEDSPRRKLIRELQDILKKDGQRGVGTGLERKARHTTLPEPEPENATGNSANAAAAAASAASKVCGAAWIRS